MPLGMEVGLSPWDFGLDENPAPPKKGGGGWGKSPPIFRPTANCGRMAGWIKMAFGMEVGLGPVHIVLDGDTAGLPKTGQSPPNFRPIFVMAKRLDASRCHLVRR